MNIYISGTGSALPSRVLKVSMPAAPTDAGEREIFTGYQETRVLAQDETLAGLLDTAARRALFQAGITAGQVDALVGWGEPSPPIHAPNILFALHRDLRLGPRVSLYLEPMVFANFVCALRRAHDLLLLEEATRVLVVCGSGYSRTVDLSKPHAATVGDGAGAVVLARDPPGSFRVLGFSQEMSSTHYGELAFHYGITDNQCHPIYNISEQGAQTVRTSGVEDPVRLIEGMLASHGIDRGEVTLLPHQASTLLLDAWARRLDMPLLHSFATHGNMSFASVPVNLDQMRAQIRTRYAILLQIGIGNCLQAALLENQAARRSAMVAPAREIPS